MGDLLMGVPASEGALFSLQWGIDVLMLGFGTWAIFLIVRINRTLKGKVRQALRYFMVGIALSLLAVISSLSSYHTLALGSATIEIHRTLMAAGFVCFVMSVMRFSKLLEHA